MHTTVPGTPPQFAAARAVAVVCTQAHLRNRANSFTNALCGRSMGNCLFSRSPLNTCVKWRPALRSVARCMKHSACSRRRTDMVLDDGAEYIADRAASIASRACDLRAS